MLNLQLFEGLDQITDADVREVTEEDVQPGEVVKCEVPVDLRRLLHLAVTIATDIDERVDASDEITPELKSERALVKAQTDLLTGIFFTELRLRLGLLNTPLGLRRGWLVVETPPRQSGMRGVVVQVISMKAMPAMSGEDGEGCDCPICRMVEAQPAGWQMHHGQS